MCLTACHREGVGVAGSPCLGACWSVEDRQANAPGYSYPLGVGGNTRPQPGCFYVSPSTGHPWKGNLPNRRRNICEMMRAPGLECHQSKGPEPGPLNAAVGLLGRWASRCHLQGLSRGGKRATQWSCPVPTRESGREWWPWVLMHGLGGRPRSPQPGCLSCTGCFWHDGCVGGGGRKPIARQFQ